MRRTLSADIGAVLLHFLVLAAVACWMFSAVEWARVFIARHDPDRGKALRTAAFATTITAVVTAGAVAVFAW